MKRGLRYNKEVSCRSENRSGGSPHIPKKERILTMADITFEIVEELGVLSTSAKGWTKELNLVSWNGRPPKYDIREWSPEHEKMGKGLTFSEEEMAALAKLLK
ncbi:hypothetical protein C8U37_1068 [Trichococcus patagoniensis]|uniref:Transcriptional coactivator p15 (PC4) C-terminal domain-containing protein n=2 Tax=root TaxID=1 RepID=A0A2T5IM48_9LACT|nr:hypothetical protein C8U37_1068 [Trichococcus patagoniensis]